MNAKENGEDKKHNKESAKVSAPRPYREGKGGGSLIILVFWCALCFGSGLEKGEG